MTFETEYARWLVLQLNAKTQKFGLTCKYYDEVSYKPLKNNPDEITVIVNGGGATRSGVQGQDSNNVSISVIVICKKDYSKRIRGAIETFQEENNAMIKTINGKLCKSVFFTPFVVDESDHPTAKGTIKATTLSFMISVAYGNSGLVSLDTFKLFVGPTAYDIAPLVKYETASIPTYDTYLAQGDAHPQQNPLSANNSWTFHIAKTEEPNDLQNLLEGELKGERRLFKKTLALNNTPVRGYLLTEGYENNTAVYVLTLSY